MAVTRDTDDVDMSKSTGSYSTPQQSGAVVDTDIDYAKSTGAYPMERTPQTMFVDTDVNYGKSTGAYPMYEDEAAARLAQVDLTQAATVTVVTPGPVSTGDPDVVTKQRADLGLSSDPSGESDAGYQARPATVTGPGYDGKDRAELDDRAAQTAAAGDSEQDIDGQAESKTIAPAERRPPRRRTSAD